MRRNLSVLLCIFSVSACASYAKGRGIKPLRAAAGTILDFHLQTRLDPAQGDAFDAVPQGTILQVKILDSVDSMRNRDGSMFHGLLASPLVRRGVVVAPAGSEVKGMLVLLRSSMHPQGFRYELLLLQLTDSGRSYALTASLHTSLADPDVERDEKAKTLDSEPSKGTVPAASKSSPKNPE